MSGRITGIIYRSRHIFHTSRGLFQHPSWGWIDQLEREFVSSDVELCGSGSDHNQLDRAGYWYHLSGLVRSALDLSSQYK
jgi:hypothetical protein